MEDADKARKRMLLMHRVLTIRDAINNKCIKEYKVDKYLIYTIRPCFKGGVPGRLAIRMEFDMLELAAGKSPPLLRFYSHEARQEFVNLIGVDDIIKFVNL